MAIIDTRRREPGNASPLPQTALGLIAGAWRTIPGWARAVIAIIVTATLAAGWLAGSVDLGSMIR